MRMGKIFPSHSRGDLSSLFRDRRTPGLASARLFQNLGTLEQRLMQQTAPAAAAPKSA